MTWREFWSRENSIYVNDRHKQVHYTDIANDIIALIPSRASRVLDFGCGEALSAPLVAEACSELLLCDTSELVRQKLVAAHTHRPNVRVLSLDDVKARPDGSLDLVVINSVIQYLSRAELDQTIALLAPKLAPDGVLVIADVIPPTASAITDALALLHYGARNGFLFAAGFGLVRTFFSDYRRKRAELGLSFYEPADITALIEAHGLTVRRRPLNLGHNQGRMTFEARPATRAGSSR